MLNSKKTKHFLCPNCGNGDLRKKHYYRQLSGDCFSETGGCNTWWPWSERLIVPLADYNETNIKKLTKAYRYKMYKQSGGLLGLLTRRIDNFWYETKRKFYYTYRRIMKGY